MPSPPFYLWEVRVFLMFQALCVVLCMMVVHRVFKNSLAKELSRMI